MKSKLGCLAVFSLSNRFAGHITLGTARASCCLLEWQFDWEVRIRNQRHDQRQSNHRHGSDRDQRKRNPRWKRDH